MKDGTDLAFQDLLYSGVVDGEEMCDTAASQVEVPPNSKTRRSSTPVSSDHLSQIPFVGPGASFVATREKYQNRRGRGKGRRRAKNVSLEEESIPSHLTRESRLARRKNLLAK